MKYPIALTVTALAALSVSFCVSAESSGAEAADATVAVRTIDFRGKPPFKRRVEHLPVSELARLETAAPQKEIVRTVDFSGKPPFRRNIERVEILDASRLEMIGDPDVTATKEKRFPQRAGLKRHR